MQNVSKTFDFNKNQSVFEKLKNQKEDHKFKKKLIALDNISFDVKKGEVLAIIGRNGSGKTTLLRLISGIYQPDSGSINVNGRLAPLLHIGTGFQAEFVAKDNITMYGLLLGLSKSEITNKIDNIIDFAELHDFSKMKLKHYSVGMRMRLAFSTALQVNADVLLMDEALAVGDKFFREKSYQAFESFKEKGKTIVFSTHSLGKADEFCDRALLLHQGKLIAIGSPSEILNKYENVTKGKNF